MLSTHLVLSLSLLTCLVQLALSSSYSPSNGSFVQMASTLSPLLPPDDFDILKIGAPATFTARHATCFSQSSDLYNGWRLFVQWLNEERGGLVIGGRSYVLELAVVEDYSRADYAARAARLLVHNYSTDFFFGPCSSTLTAATLEHTEPADTLVISASSLHDHSCNESELLVSLQPPAATFTRALFSTLQALGAESVAVLVDYASDSYCQNVTELEALAVEYNIALQSVHTVDQQHYDSSLRSILLTLQGDGVDVVAACPARDVASSREQQAQGLCLQLPLLARNLSFAPSALLFLHCPFDDPTLAMQLGSAAAHLLSVMPWHPSPRIVDSDAATGWTAAEFHDNYVAQFRVVPTHHAAAAFASGTLLQVALEELQSPQSDPDNFRAGGQLAGLLKTSSAPRPSVFGNMSFNSCGESQMELLVVQVQMLEKEGRQVRASVVLPAHYASDVPLVYPAPSWATRLCQETTARCSGHGTCSAEGNCECQPNYYGLLNPSSCDSQCAGEVVSGFCIDTQTFYIGGTYEANFAEHVEHIAHMRHAVQLINNKTDGWFDQEMPQVHLVLSEADSGCSGDVAEEALRQLQQWAVTESGGASRMTALLGSYCSGASKGIASQANIDNFLQVSYASTSEDLSNVNFYRYFARTAPSDAVQGPLLAKTLIALGLTPYIAVVHQTASYAASLAKSIVQKYGESGQYQVLLTYAFDSESTSDEEYHDIIFRIGQSGAAVIVFVGYQDIAIKVFAAAALHPVLSTSQVMWVGVDAWTGSLLHDVVPLGVLGITPHVANTRVTADYVSRWEALPPREFPSISGKDRHELAPYSASLVDAALALGLTLQRAIDQHLGIEGSSLFNEISSADVIKFDGLSGTVQFDAAGDLKSPIFALSNYRSRVGASSSSSGDDSAGEWVEVGNVTETSFFVDTTLLQWPGGASDGAGFGQQLRPWCAAGFEPLLTFATGIYSCSPCRVGWFKSSDGHSSCAPCPSGAMCADTGIAVPCVETGYWREPAAAELGVGDFSTFQIYRCEMHDICRGGCALNNSCATDRQHSSPVCAVCVGDAYMSDHKCHSCAENSMDSESFRLAAYLLMSLGMTVFLAAILLANLMSTPTSTRARGEVEDIFITESLINDMQGSKDRVGGSASEAARHSSSSSWESQAKRERESESGCGIEDDSKGGVEMTDRGSGPLGTEKAKGSSWARRQSRSSVRRLLVQNKDGFKKFIRGASITGKITLSFLQVLTGSFLTLNLKYPHYMHQFFVDLQINPFHPIYSAFKCSDQAADNNNDTRSEDNWDGHVFFVSILFSVLSPFLFLLILGLAVLVSRVAYFKLVYPKKRALIQDRKQFFLRQFTKTYNLSIKLYIWFCLIMYPVLSANILGVFNCRDLGFSGVFLRGDYAVSCESDSYQATRQVALLGIVVVPIGVPLFFAALIYHRDCKWLTQPAFFLHGNFLPAWRYFEVLDLVRKLLLTSIVPFVGEVDSTSQCLYLLLLDACFLVVLAYSKPYQNSRDDFLALALVTTECVAFLLGVVIVSGIDKEDNYHTSALYACIFAWFVLDLIVLMPLSLAAKFASVTREVARWRGALVGGTGRCVAAACLGVAREQPPATGTCGTTATIGNSRIIALGTNNPMH